MSKKPDSESTVKEEKKKRTTPYQLFMEAARELCLEIKILHKKPRVIELTMVDKKGRRTSIPVKGLLKLNEEGTRDIIRDKKIAEKVMKNANIMTPRTHFFRVRKPENLESLKAMRATKEYAALRKFTSKVGFPVFLKPNMGSQGRGVMRVMDHDTLDPQLQQYAMRGRREVPLIQEALKGKEYRIMAIFGDILLGVHRQPFAVKGDGKSTIRQLVKRRLKKFHKEGRLVKLRSNSPKIASYLEQQGLSLDTMLEDGKSVFVIANNNLTDGADPNICTDYVRDHHSELVHKIHDVLGMNKMGIDMIEDMRTGKPVPYVLEVNARPGLGQVINSSPENRELVKQFFKDEIMKKMRQKQMEQRLSRRAAQAKKKSDSQAKAQRHAAREHIIALLKSRGAVSQLHV